MVWHPYNCSSIEKCTIRWDTRNTCEGWSYKTVECLFLFNNVTEIPHLHSHICSIYWQFFFSLNEQIAIIQTMYIVCYFPSISENINLIIISTQCIANIFYKHLHLLLLSLPLCCGDNTFLSPWTNFNYNKQCGYQVMAREWLWLKTYTLGLLIA